MKYTKSECENKIAKWQKRLAELKEDLIVGEWYHVKGIGLLVYNNDEPTYGFWNGVFNEDYMFSKWKGTTLATVTEVEEALTKEAKHRGFDFDNYYYHKGELRGGSFGPSGHFFIKFLFDNGKWTEATPTYTHKELVDLIGHEFVHIG